MTLKTEKPPGIIPFNGLVGTVSWGKNRPGVFLKLCQIFRDFHLDIIDVDSHVSFGWFVKTIIARNKNKGDFTLQKFRKQISKLAKELAFTSKCFIFTQSDYSSDSIDSLVLVIYSEENKIGLLAEILETLNIFEIDILNITIEMGKEEKSFAIEIKMNIAVVADNFFHQLENLRQELENLKVRLKMKDFHFIIHSVETFNYIHKIDYESGYVSGGEG